jgi:SOS response regulatory protein OraA/RecX
MRMSRRRIREELDEEGYSPSEIAAVLEERDQDYCDDHCHDAEFEDT